MKNLMKPVGNWCPHIKKGLLIMRLSVFLILIAVFTSTASVYSQATRLTVKMENARLSEVFDAIEKQSEFYFFYNRDYFNDERIVSVDFEDKLVEEVLKELFKNEAIKYEIYDRNILLTISDAPLTTAQQEVMQQQRSVSGKVTDTSGQPLPGVTIVIKGTTQGTVTNADGKYSLTSIPDDATLVFSFVGMRTEEVVVGNQTNINVEMEEETIGIEEIIAVGYQSKQKKNMTGSVSTISSEQLRNRPTAKLTSVLSGTAPGLQVVRSNPGRIGRTNESLRIGGITSRADPGILVVIDGIPQEEGASEALNTLNPNDVESITVLKDAEAVIFGARASGGVLVITTKDGDKPRLVGSVSTSLRVPHIHPVKTNMLQSLEMLEEGWTNNGVTPLWGYPNVLKYIEDNNITFDDIKNNNFDHVVTGNAPFPDTPFLVFGHTDWFEQMYGTGTSKNYDISASGSSEKTNYYASMGIVDEGTMLKYGNNTSYTYYARLKYEYRHNDFIKVGANLGLRYQKLTEPTGYGNIQSLTDQRHTYDHPYTPEGRYMNWGGFQNPIGWAEEGGDNIIKYYDIKPQLYAEITPVRNLNIRGNFAKNASFRGSRSLLKSFQHYYWNESPSMVNVQPYQTSVNSQVMINNAFTGNFQATYSGEISEDHVIRVLMGISHEEFEQDITNAWKNDLVYDELFTLNLGDSEEQFNSDNQSQYAIRSAFGNISYSFAEKYILEGSMRYDGSSRFAEGYKWKPFLGGGAAWNVSNENFFSNLDPLLFSNLKLRVSWGQLGNQQSIGLYDFVSRLNINQSNLLLGDPTSVYRLQTATLSGFPSLTRTWEIAEKLNFGLDLEMLNNRLNSAVNYYITENKNMFYSEEFPSVLGTAPPSINGAHVQTKGWDFSLEWNDQVNNDFSYFARFGISDSKTKVISLSDSRIVRYGYNGFVEGYPVGTIFGYDFDGLVEDDADLERYKEEITAGVTTRVRVGDAKYKDLDGDGIIESAVYEVDENGDPLPDSGDLIELGDGERHYIYYLNLGFDWKGFDVSVLLNGVGKWNVWETNGSSHAYPWIQPLEHFYHNTWSPDRPNAKYPRLSVVGSDFNADRSANNYRISNAPYVQQNVPYLAITNIKLGYTLPETWSERLKTERLYLYANVADLGYIINKMPQSFSPEQPYNSNITPYPQIFSFGIDINF